jgi:hypothetical protein
LAGACSANRHLEFIRFLNAVERQVPADKPIHLLLENDATHKHPKVLAWLARHPRWTFHPNPTSASWLADSGGSRPRIRDDVAHHSDLFGIHHRISGQHLQAYAREIAWREDNRRVANGTQWKWIISAALSHPKSATWAGYWHREKTV